MFCSLRLLLMKHLKRKTVFLKEKAAIYIYFDFTYNVYGRFLYLDRRSCCARTCLKNHFRNLQVHFAVYLPSFVCRSPLKPSLVRTESPTNWDSRLTKNLFGYALIQRFTNNYTIHAGYGFEWTGLETQA